MTFLADETGEDFNPLTDPLLLVMFGLIALFMIFTLRRGRKMREAQRDAHSGAVVGAEVITAGGLVGTVVHRDEERQRITLEFSTGDRADFLLGAVQQVTEPAPGQPGTHGPETTDPTSGDKN